MFRACRWFITQTTVSACGDAFFMTCGITNAAHRFGRPWVVPILVSNIVSGRLWLRCKRFRMQTAISFTPCNPTVLKCNALSELNCTRTLDLSGCLLQRPNTTPFTFHPSPPPSSCRRTSASQNDPEGYIKRGASSAAGIHFQPAGSYSVNEARWSADGDGDGGTKHGAGGSGGGGISPGWGAGVLGNFAGGGNVASDHGRSSRDGVRALRIVGFGARGKRT